MFQEGLYLLRKNEFIQNNQYIYKFGRSTSILNRMDNYSNGSIIHLLISCEDTKLHERKILALFRNKYTMQLYYGCEYFLGNVENMKEDIINYVSNVMQDKGYQIVNNNVLIERVNKDTNKKIPKFERDLHKIQVVSIPSKINDYDKKEIVDNQEFDLKITEEMLSDKNILDEMEKNLSILRAFYRSYELLSQNDKQMYFQSLSFKKYKEIINNFKKFF